MGYEGLSFSLLTLMICLGPRPIGDPYLVDGHPSKVWTRIQQALYEPSEQNEWLASIEEACQLVSFFLFLAENRGARIWGFPMPSCANSAIRMARGKPRRKPSRSNAIMQQEKGISD